MKENSNSDWKNSDLKRIPGNLFRLCWKEFVEKNLTKGEGNGGKRRIVKFVFGFCRALAPSGKVVEARTKRVEELVCHLLHRRRPDVRSGPGVLLPVYYCDFLFSTFLFFFPRYLNYDKSLNFSFDNGAYLLSSVRTLFKEKLLVSRVFFFHQWILGCSAKFPAKVSTKKL